MEKFYLAACLLVLSLSVGLGLEIAKVRELEKQPTKLTKNTEELRIPIDELSFRKWERKVDDERELIETYLTIYLKTAAAWDDIFNGPNYNQEDGHRDPTVAERVDTATDTIINTYIKAKGKKPPKPLRRLIDAWATTIKRPLLSDRIGRVGQEPPDIPPDAVYAADMLEQDFPQDYRPPRADENAEIELRTTADHLRRFLRPVFLGETRFRIDRKHMWTVYQRVARYLVNAVNEERNSEKGTLRVPFQSTRDIVYVDPNKTTRMRNTLLKIRDQFIHAKARGLSLGWELQTQLDAMDNLITSKLSKKAPDDIKQWNRAKVALTRTPEIYWRLAHYLDVLTEVLRVMEVPAAPGTGELLTITLNTNANANANANNDNPEIQKPPSSAPFEAAEIGSPEDGLPPEQVFPSDEPGSPSSQSSADPTIIHEISDSEGSKDGAELKVTIQEAELETIDDQQRRLAFSKFSDSSNSNQNTPINHAPQFGFLKVEQPGGNPKYNTYKARSRSSPERFDKEEEISPAPTLELISSDKANPGSLLKGSRESSLTGTPLSFSLKQGENPQGFSQLYRHPSDLNTPERFNQISLIKAQGPKRGRISRGHTRVNRPKMSVFSPLSRFSTAISQESSQRNDNI
ncbi:hypothetical protein ABW19_dt0207821 [Dactylella cylindrospora]|nr:hypothetical protein ABW19_dt0207821 [Dactylella cylindrospora]